MASEEIKTIYKKLVQSYANDYPSDPLRILNMHIEAYIKHEWKAKEPAILDLALRKNIEIPKVKELIEKGKTRKEAILEISKNMKFRVSEKEVEKWLPKGLKKEEPGEEVKEVTKEKMEQQIGDYKRSIERLTTLFSKGEITEESYKTAIKTIERNKNELRSGKKVSVAEERKETIARTRTLNGWYRPQPTKLWYLAPFFFNIIGGLIGYVAVKDEDRDMATNLLIFGIFMTLVDMFIAWLLYSWLLSVIMSSFGI